MCLHLFASPSRLKKLLAASSVCLILLWYKTAFEEEDGERGTEESFFDEASPFPLVTFESDGRLSNWLLEYASLYLLARKLDIPVRGE